ncbi:melanoma-associated antigen B4-like [Arvicola amphibius]|uniref:melanoma-associated antigen B4-like n=1 Tax=Arvicola amphibius TaxID=1047088 RepID=UPI001C09C942|nr:melanoma-associated antigen B4-like [Arvicola amphibius]
MKTEGKDEFSPLAEALLVIDSYWERENLSSLRWLALASLPYSNGNPHIQEYKNSETELDEWVKKRGHGVVSIGKKGFIWEELGEWICFASPPAYILTLLCLNQVIMPRGHKSKGRSRAKHQNIGEKNESLPDAEPTAEEEATSSIDQGNLLSSSDINIPQDTQGDVASVSDDSEVLTGAVGGETSDTNAESSVVRAERHSFNSIIVSTFHSEGKGPLFRKTRVLMQFILQKFKVKASFTRGDMLIVINKKYKEHFPEIMRRITVHLEIVFGLELKEVDSSPQSFMVVGKLGLSTEGRLSNRIGLPKTGLLITLLAMIFSTGNSATEEDVWEYLKIVGVFPGQDHPIFEEPRKFITKDLVQENYLSYSQIPGSDPPCYEFRWGPRACTEITKMQVLWVVSRINDTIPAFFPNLFAEALVDETNRAARRKTVLPGTVVKSRTHFE